MSSAEEIATRDLPLEGVRVLEFCQVAAGPFCSMLLADFGADVIKIEHPVGGDGLRQWPPITEGFSENFASLNRNKRSVALDLKSTDGQKAALALAATANVIVENNRPGVMDRLGLGFEAMRERQPRIIYASISGFGQTGPRSQEGGFDVTIQAMGGVMSVTGERDGGPVKCGVPISDFSTGLYAAFAIASALRAAERTGVGRQIDISLLGATLGVAALQTSEFFGTGNSPIKLGAAHPRNAPYEAFQAADDWFVMAAGNDKLWAAVCEMVGREDLRSDDRFKTNANRAKHQIVLKGILEDEFRSRPAAHWIASCRDLGIPCGAINSYEAALNDPQVAAMGWVQTITLPSGTETKTFGCPVRLNGETLMVRRNPPELGAHTQEVLREIGMATTTNATTGRAA